MAAIVLVTRRLPEAVEERLRRDYTPRLNPQDRPYGPDELVERSAGASAILACATDAWPAGVIERLPGSVRAIATFSAGHEHIDLAAASAHGITITNTPNVLTEATADLAMLCLLGAARRAFEGEALIRAGQWAGWAPTQLLGLELNGATLGIVGMGRIGQALARRARAFGMPIHYCSRRRLPPELEGDARFHQHSGVTVARSEVPQPALPGDARNHGHDQRRRARATAPRGSAGEHRPRRAAR